MSMNFREEARASRSRARHELRALRRARRARRDRQTQNEEGAGMPLSTERSCVEKAGHAAPGTEQAAVASCTSLGNRTGSIPDADDETSPNQDRATPTTDTPEELLSTNAPPDTEPQSTEQRPGSRRCMLQVSPSALGLFHSVSKAPAAAMKGGVPGNVAESDERPTSDSDEPMPTAPKVAEETSSSTGKPPQAPRDTLSIIAADDRRGTRAPETSDTDLWSLPGIGAGLVELLGSAGIGRIEDLADSEPAALRTRLGLAGQLLDLEGWITEAAMRRSCGTRRDPSSETIAK